MEHGEVMLSEMTETDLEVEAAPLGKRREDARSRARRAYQGYARCT
jgi:hypothetical protein